MLANEEVTAEGKSERGNFPVFQRRAAPMVHAHHAAPSDRRSYDGIDWPEKVKLMQRNWIGESHGASVHFEVETPNGVKDMEIYTTRPDTLFGTTFAVVSPEHHLLEAFSPNGRPRLGRLEGWLCHSGRGGEGLPLGCGSQDRQGPC